MSSLINFPQTQHSGCNLLKKKSSLLLLPLIEPYFPLYAPAFLFSCFLFPRTQIPVAYSVLLHVGFCSDSFVGMLSLALAGFDRFYAWLLIISSLCCSLFHHWMELGPWLSTCFCCRLFWFHCIVSWFVLTTLHWFQQKFADYCILDLGKMKLKNLLWILRNNGINFWCLVAWIYSDFT